MSCLTTESNQVRAGEFRDDEDGSLDTAGTRAEKTFTNETNRSPVGRIY